MPEVPKVRMNQGIPGNNMNTIAVMDNVERNRYANNEEYQRNNYEANPTSPINKSQNSPPHQPYNNNRISSGISGISNIRQQVDRSRMLRSSQGGRWFRSQSLMQ